MCESSPTWHSHRPAGVDAVPQPAKQFRGSAGSLVGRSRYRSSQQAVLQGNCSPGSNTPSTEARFPTTENPSKKEHVIRLITRLLFIWFIKEKQLVNPDLFNEEQICSLLTNYDPETGDSYYRAILQNLFFATLNTEIRHRGFNDTTSDNDFSQYRYRDEIADPDRLLALFAETPFINGGLFDCLDSPTDTTDGQPIDCFSDDPQHQELLSIPNRLFFGEGSLIDLFDDYWFTVEENTPIEQDVALDPELLGRVFENLLAAFNPETEEERPQQVRVLLHPQTGRGLHGHRSPQLPIGKKPSLPADGDPDRWELRLRDLLDYADDGTDEISDAHEFFQQTERQALIRNIANIKTVDPAVGSGAFPMAILHRLILVLQRLDTDNSQWQQIQEEIASRAGQPRLPDSRPTRTRQAPTSDQRHLPEIPVGLRTQALPHPKQHLRRGYSAHRLPNRQTPGVHLPRHRTATSNSDPGDNYGIRPLPNLETRFVAADTLIGTERPTWTGLSTAVATRRETCAPTGKCTSMRLPPNTNKRSAPQTRTCGAQLATALQSGGMAPDQARKSCRVETHTTRTTSADWFDTKYMFNITDGFDIVIGNPPYIQLQDEGGRLGNKYDTAGYTTFAKSGDIYVLFYEKGCQLLKPTQGVLAYITSNSWMKALYGKKLRQYLTGQHTPLMLLEMGKDVFDAVVDTNILLAREGGSGGPFPAVDRDTHSQTEDFPPPAQEWGQVIPSGATPWRILSPTEQRVLDKIKTKGTPLSQWDIRINYGIKTGYNRAFIIDKTTRDALIAEDPNSDDIIKPVLRGKDLRPYQANWADLFLIATIPARNLDITEYPAVMRHLLSFGQPRLEQAGKLLASGGRSRKRTSHSWFELQDSIAYYREFEKPNCFGRTCLPRDASHIGIPKCIASIQLSSRLGYHSSIFKPS